MQGGDDGRVVVDDRRDDDSRDDACDHDGSGPERRKSAREGAGLPPVRHQQVPRRDPPDRRDVLGARVRCLAANADPAPGLGLIRGTRALGIGRSGGRRRETGGAVCGHRQAASGRSLLPVTSSAALSCASPSGARAQRRSGTVPGPAFAHLGRLLLKLSQPVQCCGVVGDVGMPAVCAGTQRGELVGVVHSLGSLSDPVSTGRLPGVGLSMQITGFRSHTRTRRPSAPARPSAVDSRTAPAVGSLAPARTATECALANRISRNPCSRARDLCRYARTATSSRPRRRVR